MSYVSSPARSRTVHPRILDRAAAAGGAVGRGSKPLRARQLDSTCVSAIEVSSGAREKAEVRHLSGAIRGVPADRTGRWLYPADASPHLRVALTQGITQGKEALVA